MTAVLLGSWLAIASKTDSRGKVEAIRRDLAAAQGLAVTLKAVGVSRERRGRVRATMVFVGAVSIPETEPLTLVNHRIGRTCSSRQGNDVAEDLRCPASHRGRIQGDKLFRFRSIPGKTALPSIPICPNSPAPTHQSACETIFDAPNQYSSTCKANVDALSHTCRGCNEVEGPRTTNRIRVEVQAKARADHPSSEPNEPRNLQ